MRDLFESIMKSKKRGKGMDDHEKDAKMGILKDIHKMASDDLGHDIKGLKKVSVMSDNDAGMQEGLKKAQEMVAHKPGHSMSDDDADDVSDDMHPESRRHQLNKKSEMTDEDDAMANPHGDEEQKNAKLGASYAKGGEVEHQHDQTEDFMENGPQEIQKEMGPGKNYAEGGILTAAERNKLKDHDFALPGRHYPIHNEAHARNALARVSQFGSPKEIAEVRSKVHAKYPGIQVHGKAHGGEIHSDASDVEHQKLQSHGMNSQFAQPIIKKEWDAGKNYAQGGQIDEDQMEHERMADATGAEHQRLQSMGMDTKAAEPTIKKEMDNRANPAHKMAKHPDVMEQMGQGTHGTHASADPADEYGDLEPEDLEALIAHLQRFRKSKPTF